MRRFKNMIEITKETQFAVLGLGRFGRAVAKTLSENGFDVLCCDKSHILVHEATQYAAHAVEADFSDETVLDQIGIGNFDVVIISASYDFETSVMTTMVCKEKKVPFVLAKAGGARHKRILERAGADHVVLAEKEMGEKTAYNFIFNNPVEYIHDSDDYDILEVSPTAKWINHSLRELKLREREGINVLGIIRGEEVRALLDPDTIIDENDRLIILTSHPIN